MEQLNLKLTLNQNGSITASWASITGAVRYHAYMIIVGEHVAVYNETNLTSTSYTSRSNLDDNQQYQVVLAAYGSSSQLATDGQKILIPSGFYKNTPFEAPQNVRATADTSSVTVSFDAVPRATSYDILFDNKVYNVTATSRKFTGLQAGTSHSYAVRAKNASETSAYSATYSITTTTQAQSLAVPSGFYKYATDTTATISWGMVSGAASYDILFNGTTYSVSSSSKTFTGLSANRAYNFSVRSRNGSSYSAYSAQATVTTAPSAPTVSATSTATTVTLKWSQAAGAKGYLVRFNGLDYSESPGTKLTETFTGLEPDTIYTYQISAAGADGTGSFGAAKTIKTLAQTLAVPGNVKKTATETTATISWGAVSGAGSYDIQFNGTTYNVNGLSKEFTGLTAGKAYPFAIRSKNGNSYSSYTSQMTVTTAPKAPTVINASSQATSATISWGAVSGAAGYIVKFNNANYQVSASNTSWTINNLSPNTAYSYQICCKSADGAGNFSSVKSVRTLQQLAVPANIKKSATQNSATISWSAVSGATGYTIAFNNTNYSVSGTTRTFTGLTAGKAYAFKICAKNATVTGAFSNEMTVTTAPAAPTGIRAESASTCVTVSWNQAAGAVGYQVWFNNKSYEAAGATCTITGLQPQTPYAYKVRSKSADGTGEYSASQTVRTLAQGLDTPTGITHSCTDNSVTVSWASVKGAAGYDLLFDNSLYKVAGTSRQITGLRAGTTHKYRVRSRIADGTIGPYSPEKSIMTAPGAPSNSKAVTNENSVTISWDPVTGATSYDLQIAGKTYRVTVTSQTVTGLSANSSYTYQLRSNNGNGSSTYSASKTIKTTPLPPASPSVSATKNSVTLSWSAVTGATSYDVLFDGSTYRVTGPYKTITGLTPGTSYTYAIRVNNADGSSSYSASRTIATTPNPPIMPLNVSATSTVNSVTINWGASSGATGYKLLFDNKTYDVTGTTKTFTGLAANTSHTYRICAVNTGGASEYTPSKTIKTLPLAPTVPTNVRAEAASYSVIVRWNAVSGADSYDLLFNGTVYNVTGISRQITGLNPSTKYSYQVRARNAGGISAYSAVNTVTTLIKPPTVAPANVNATATTNSVTISWGAVGGATSYVVEFNGNYSVATGTSTKFGNLSPGTTYTYAVRAKNAGGTGPFSKQQTIRTIQIAPGVPGNIRAVAESDSVTVSWNEASRADSYELLFNGTAYTLTGCDYEVKGLTANTEYSYQVRAVNEAGVSAYSAAQVVRTRLEVPRNIHAEATARTVTVYFDPVDGADSYDISINGQTYNTKETFLVIGQLEPLTQYSYFVLARNAYVESRYSSQKQISTLRPGPDMPSDITAYATMDSVIISWSPVPEAEDYDIQFDDITYHVAGSGAVRQGEAGEADQPAPAALCFDFKNESPVPQVNKADSVGNIAAQAGGAGPVGSMAAQAGGAGSVGSMAAQADEAGPVGSMAAQKMYWIFAGLKPNTKHSYCARANNAEGSSPYTDKKHVRTDISKDSGLAQGKERRTYPDGRISYMGNDPVNALTGAFLWSYTWLEDHGKDSLHFTTMYDSQRDAGDGVLGKKWTHSLNYLLSMDEEYAYFTTPYDSVASFAKNAENGGFEPAQDASGYRMEQDEDGCYHIKAADGAEYIFDSGLCLKQIMENGLMAYGFQADEEGRITRIEGRHGAGMDIVYGESRIASVRDAMGNSVSFSYEEGRLTAVTNPDGSEMCFSYDDAYNLLTITDFAGEVYLTNQYDMRGRVTEQLTAGRGRSLVSYDEENRVTSFTDEAGNVTRYSYDEKGHVTDVTLAGTHIHNSYNENGQLTERQDALGNSTKMVYDDYGRMCQMTYPDETQESVTYNDHNQPVRVVGRDGTENLYQYDGHGNLTRAQDERGNVSTYTYDEEDNLISFTDKGGNVWTYAYDSNNHLEQARDPEGNIYLYTHDAIGRMTSYTSPAGKKISYQYSAAGDLLCMEDGDGAVLFTYDSNGNRTGVTDKMGNRQRLEYNEMGQVRLATDCLGNEYQFSYDALGNLVTETDPLGCSVGYTYDALGNRISRTDPNGGETRYYFDAASRLIQVKDAAGGTVSYTYDNMGQVKTVTDQLSHQTSYAYDQAGRILRETDALEHSVSYAYDEAGNMLTRTDEDGVVTHYTYDADNRLLSIRTDGGTTSFTYDKLGRITSVLDVDGHMESAEYDGDGNLTASSDKEGRQTSYIYDSMGRLIQETAPNGGKTAYTYDKNGNCVKVVDAEEHVYTYEYDANNRMVKSIDPMELETAFFYDGRGQLIRVVDARGGVTAYSYDGNGNLTGEVNPLGGERTYTYDSLNRLTGGRDEVGNGWSCSYDAAGNRTSYTDANGNQWSYEYDANNRLISVTDQNEGSLTFTYTNTGRVSSVTDAEGAVTGYQYDTLGRLTQISDALGHSMAFSYDSVGRLLSQTDGGGNTTQYGYSPAGNLVSVTDPEGNVTAYTYDALGQVLTREDSLGNQISYTYDLLGQATSMTDALGNTTQFTYTADGRIATVEDAEGNITRYAYDACGNLILTTDALGHVTDYQYDLRNNKIRECLSESGQHSCITLYQYDKKGRMIKEINPLLEEKTYGYDGNDNLISITDEEQQETTVSYDLNNRPISVVYGDGRMAALRYNKRGELVELQDWNGTTAMERDSLGRLTKVTDHNGRTTGFTYDGAGNRTGVTYPDGSAAAFAYDRNNRLVQVTDGEGALSQYSYDGAGNMVSMAQPGSVASYSYNANGQPVKAAYRFADASGVEEVFTYDVLGRIIGSQRIGSAAGSMTDGAVGNMAGGIVSRAMAAGSSAADMTGVLRTAAYAYDVLGRLTSYRNGQTVEAYTYDALGNRTSRSLDGVQRAACQYNALNQLTSMVEDGVVYSFGYDKRGNLTQEYREDSLIRQYAYDAAGYMALGKNLESGEETAYTYNALGMCVKNVQKLAEAGGLRTREMQYVPDYLSVAGNDLMAYEMGAGGTGNAAAKGTIIDSIRTIFGRGYERLNQKTAAGKTFFHSDIYGSPMLTMDGQGQMQQYVERSIWGDLKSGTDIPSGLEENLRFTSYRQDPVIGRYFAQARFYDSANGRMLGKDPIKRGLNPYPYCDNDPVDYTDPTGEILNVVASMAFGGLLEGVAGFVDSAISQVTSGQKFSLRKAAGAFVNGAVVGTVRGGLISTGVGIPLAFAADFAAGTLGSTLEQYISEGKVSTRKSITRGLTNAAGNLIYGTGKPGSLGEAFLRGFGAGASTSGINYISDALGSSQGASSGTNAGMSGAMAGAMAGLNAPIYGMFRNPRNGCGSESPFDMGLGYSSAKGYQYRTPQTGNKSRGSMGFSLKDFLRETLIGGATGGLASATFYGTDRAVKSLKDSIDRANIGDALLLKFDSGDEEQRAVLDIALKNAGPSTADEFKVIGHGNTTSIMFGNTPLDARKVAHVIRNSPGYRGKSQKIILYSCNTGRDPNGIAQQLADILGCVVEAPNRQIRPLETGGFLVADVIKRFGRKRLDMGDMIPFKPNI